AAGRGGRGTGGEFDILRAVFARLGPAGRDLGDDCALLSVGGRTLAVSIDLSLEGVHFRTDWLSFREIGWRATAAALSDLAAEGATPLGVLVSLGVPGNRQRRIGNAAPAVEIMAGVGAAVRSVGAIVLGGDLVRSPRFLVDVCALGLAPRPVRRSGARPGDGVWVSGRLGGAGVALRALQAGRRLAPVLRRRFARVLPRIAAGRWLGRHGARAMIDISDGLAGDAGHLAAASGVRVAIELRRIPCWPGVAPRAAVRSGEEYELLVAMPRRFGDAGARAFRRATGLPLTRIGRCEPGRGLRMTDNGQRITPPAGFDHFSAG
ncbi:MAG TPA: thiamine-phosphate kinase, partial [Gemmatimonadales bacterium]|nr:thiamine-phosphate kinase [Gemmatimonadales bacterium]